MVRVREAVYADSFLQGIVSEVQKELDSQGLGATKVPLSTVFLYADSILDMVERDLLDDVMKGLGSVPSEDAVVHDVRSKVVSVLRRSALSQAKEAKQYRARLDGRGTFIVNRGLHDRRAFLNSEDSELPIPTSTADRVFQGPPPPPAPAPGERVSMFQ